MPWAVVGDTYWVFWLRRSDVLELVYRGAWSCLLPGHSVLVSFNGRERFIGEAAVPQVSLLRPATCPGGARCAV